MLRKISEELTDASDPKVLYNNHIHDRLSKGNTMATVQDVAAYILQKTGELPTMKLQKLLYYCQAWSLVWDDAPLFAEKVEAWAYGPVIPELYLQHKGEFTIATVEGDDEALTAIQKETIDQVLAFYGDKPTQWLTELSRQENPWFTARQGVMVGQRGNQEIPIATMAEYYASL